MRPAPLALLAALAAALAFAAEAPAPGEIPLQLRVGEATSLCPCPVSRFICDDASLVKLVDEPAGQSLVGLKPGTTLCSLSGPDRARRFYRVTVVEPAPGRRR